MKNAIILHGTDFDKSNKQRFGNWFPWLKVELEKLGYKVWLPELPMAHEPDIKRYWDFVKKFQFNQETIVIGHSSGGAAIFGILNKLSLNKKIKMAIVVSGFYKDEGWNCERLFKEKLNWDKIKNQASNIYVIYSPDDPYIKKYQTDYLIKKLKVKPIIFKNMGHFNLEAGTRFKKFPELLKIINKYSS